MWPDSKLAIALPTSMSASPQIAAGFPPAIRFEAFIISFWAAGITFWRPFRKDQSGANASACQHHLARFKGPAINCQPRIDP
jgi:hypothetical protein